MATLYLEESLLPLEDGFCTELASSVFLLVLVHKNIRFSLKIELWNMHEKKIELVISTFSTTDSYCRCFQFY